MRFALENLKAYVGLGKGTNMANVKMFARVLAITIALLAPTLFLESVALASREEVTAEGSTFTFYEQGTPVEPTQKDLQMIADQSGVSDVNARYVKCWDYARRVDVTQYWVQLGIHWCWNSSQSTGHSVWEWTRFDVKGALTEYVSSSSSSGPRSQGVVIASAYGQWHFRSPGPGINVNYYPWIQIDANNRGSVITTVHT